MENLQKLYMESGITLAKLSELSGISVSTVHRYVTGRVKEKSEIYYNPIYSALQNLHPQEEESGETNVEKSVSVDICDLKEQMNRNTLLNKVIVQNPKRGDIYYIKNNYATGTEQYGSRPGLIVSSSKLNESIGTVTVVYLTGQPRNPLPTHVTIRTSRDSVVLCEQLFSVSKERLNNYMGHVTESEMYMVDKSIMTGLGLKYNQVDVSNSSDYLRLQIENRMLKDFNENLMSILAK